MANIWLILIGGKTVKLFLEIILYKSIQSKYGKYFY